MHVHLYTWAFSSAIRKPKFVLVYAMTHVYMVFLEKHSAQVTCNRRFHSRWSWIDVRTEKQSSDRVLKIVLLPKIKPINSSPHRTMLVGKCTRDRIVGWLSQLAWHHSMVACNENMDIQPERRQNRLPLRWIRFKNTRICLVQLFYKRYSSSDQNRVRREWHVLPQCDLPNLLWW